MRARNMSMALGLTRQGPKLMSFAFFLFAAALAGCGVAGAVPLGGRACAVGEFAHDEGRTTSRFEFFVFRPENQVEEDKKELTRVGGRS